MTIVWIGLIILGIIIIIAAFTVGDWLPFTDGPAYFCAGGIIVCLTGIICFFAVPVTGYMKVESTHWNWTVDIYTYRAVNESGKTGEKSSYFGAKQAAERCIPVNAYDVDITINSGSHEVVDKKWTDDNGHTHKETHTEHYYYARYTYTINKWEKTSEVNSFGKDKNPYEPERPYDITAPDVLGNHKCGAGHNETYTVTGIVDGEIKTYTVSKFDWEQIGNNDDFGYKKFRFGKEIWDLQIAQ